MLAIEGHIWPRISCHHLFALAVKGQHNTRDKARPIVLQDNQHSMRWRYPLEFLPNN